MRATVLLALGLASSVAAAACGAPGGSGTPPTVPFSQKNITSPVRVLLLTATAGFRHDSIPTARQVLTSGGTASGDFTVTATENLSDINATTLASTDVLMFILTSGELPFDVAQRLAIVQFVQSGGGFIGAHSATDTLYSWPEYGQLIGAYFKEHPWTQSATVVVENRTHATTRMLGSSFSISEEFYTFRENPRPNVDVLLSIDAASVGAQGDFPLAWSHTFGSGRIYYNALGHFSSTWNDARFQAQMHAAILWAAKRVD